MSSFYVEIKLGDDWMQTSEDVSNALHKIITKLLTGQLSGKVYDANGNSVGTFGFRPPPPPPKTKKKATKL